MLLKVPEAASDGEGGRFVMAVTLPGLAGRTGPRRSLTLE